MRTTAFPSHGGTRLAAGTLRAGEAGLVPAIIAPQVVLARTAAGVVKQNPLHDGDPGWNPTAGKRAFAFTPSDIDAHVVCRFVHCHIRQHVPAAGVFALTTMDVDGQRIH